jgi:hypothetical protein
MVQLAQGGRTLVMVQLCTSPAVARLICTLQSGPRLACLCRTVEGIPVYQQRNAEVP